MDKTLIVLCVDNAVSQLSPVDFAFGPFDGEEHLRDFLTDHDNLCSRIHSIRVLNDGAIGRNLNMFLTETQVR